MFTSVLVNGLVPLLLLVPLSRGSGAASAGLPAASRLRWLHALDRRLERGLGWLACGGVLPAEQGGEAESESESESEAEADVCTQGGSGVSLGMLRRLVMLAILWLLCCMLES